MTNETKTINTSALRTLHALEKTIRDAAYKVENLDCEDDVAADQIIEVHASLDELIGRITKAKKAILRGE